MTLELDHKSVTLGGKCLLDDVDLCLAPGEVTAIIGANGAGKTTLLRVASGELHPDLGQVRLDGAPLHRLNREARARRIAVLPQHSMLDFPFRVAEVLDMGRIPHMTGKAVNQRLVHEVAEVMQLEGFLDRIYTTLSGGERQRVQIGRVLCQLWDVIETGYFLFDEPTAALDLAHQLDFLAIARDLAARGAGVLLILHDINLAARFADRIVLLEGGRVLAKGLPADVLTNDNIKAGFDVDVELIGDARMILASRPTRTRRSDEEEAGG